jgi:hypothetical protein
MSDDTSANRPMPPPPTPRLLQAPGTYIMPNPMPLPAAGYPMQPHLNTYSQPGRPNFRAVSPWGRLGAYVLEGLLATVTLGIGWLIWAAMIAGTGQTPAKRLLKQRVINADTLRPAGFAKMFFVRGLLGGIVAGFAITFTVGILLFMPFWDKRNQNLWDKVSNTYVVHDPNDQWATKPDLR